LAFESWKTQLQRHSTFLAYRHCSVSNQQIVYGSYMPSCSFLFLTAFYLTKASLYPDLHNFIYPAIRTAVYPKLFSRDLTLHFGECLISMTQYMSPSQRTLCFWCQILPNI